MRVLIAIILLASCAPAPQAQRVERPKLEPLVVHCSAEGEAMIEYEGELIATGRDCDAPRQNYDHWLSERERGA